MERIIILFSFTLFIGVASSAEEKGFGMCRIPIEKAHQVLGAASEALLNPTIKALVWNIKKTQESGWKKEFMEFGKNQDLFIIQEAYTNNFFNSTLEAFQGIRWDMGISFLYCKDNDTPTGTMVGSKVEPTGVIIKHSPDVEPFTNTPKSMTFVKYPIKGSDKDVLVISVHGINFTTFTTFKRHMIQAEEEILKHTGPVLFTGDFNTRTKERLKYLFDMSKRLNMKTVDFKNGHLRMKAVGTNNILDHSFTKEFKIINAEVVGTAVGSDHKPMLLEMSVIEQ